MKILFVKSNKIGSKTIRWGTGEPASHVVVQFSEPTRMYHSYTTGVREEPTGYLEDHYEVVSQIIIPLKLEQERNVWRAFSATIPGKQNYDYFGLGYFAYRAVLKKFLGIDYPRLNHWQTEEGFLCTEITYLLATAFAQELAIMILPENKDLAMVTPWQLRTLLIERMKLCKLHFSYSAS